MKSLIETAIEKGFKYKDLTPQNIVINETRKQVEFYTDTREMGEANHIKIENFKVSFGDFFSNMEFISKLISEEKYTEFLKAEDKVKFLKEN